ncbi:MAG: KOW motif-containing protein [Candidatus Nanohaloarchaea archaeon]
MTHQKRLSAPKHYPVDRKGLTYTTTAEGSRSPENGITAVVFLREVTGYADTKKEAKKILRKGKLLRNGDEVRSVRDTLGVMDVVELPDADETFRVLPRPESMEFMETEDDRTAAKITGKRVEGDEFVYSFHSGENYRTEEEYSTGTTLIFNDEVEAAELEKGKEAVILDGKHAGKIAEIEEIHGRGMRPDTATVKTDEEFEIRQDKLFSIGGLEVN